MWDHEKQQRFDLLQQRVLQTPLTAEEQQQLDLLVFELEQEEWAALRPALRHLRREQEELGADIAQTRMRTAQLGALAERYADLLARAQGQFDALAHEREVLREA
jgi:hypothetical protein